MELKGKKFVAVVATPSCGKSYLSDNYEEFADVDEIRLYSRYYIPNDVTREELESTKGNRQYPKRENWREIFEKNLNIALKDGKILICSPHPEIKEFLIRNKLPYLFVFPKDNMRNEMKRRMINRGNTEQFVNKNYDLFYTYLRQNKNEAFAVVKYKLKKNEYLTDVLKLAGLDFNQLHKKNSKK